MAGKTFDSDTTFICVVLQPSIFFFFGGGLLIFAANKHENWEHEEAGKGNEGVWVIDGQGYLTAPHEKYGDEGKGELDRNLNNVGGKNQREVGA